MPEALRQPEQPMTADEFYTQQRPDVQKAAAQEQFRQEMGELIPFPNPSLADQDKKIKAAEPQRITEFTENMAKMVPYEEYQYPHEVEKAAADKKRAEVEDFTKKMASMLPGQEAIQNSSMTTREVNGTNRPEAKPEPKLKVESAAPQEPRDLDGNQPNNLEPQGGEEDASDADEQAEGEARIGIADEEEPNLNEPLSPPEFEIPHGPNAAARKPGNNRWDWDESWQWGQHDSIEQPGGEDRKQPELSPDLFDAREMPLLANMSDEELASKYDLGPKNIAFARALTSVFGNHLDIRHLDDILSEAEVKDFNDFDQDKLKQLRDALKAEYAVRGIEYNYGDTDSGPETELSYQPRTGIRGAVDKHFSKAIDKIVWIDRPIKPKADKRDDDDRKPWRQRVRNGARTVSQKGSKATTKFIEKHGNTHEKTERKLGDFVLSATQRAQQLHGRLTPSQAVLGRVGQNQEDKNFVMNEAEKEIFDEFQSDPSLDNYQRLMHRRLAQIGGMGASQEEYQRYLKFQSQFKDDKEYSF
jgi:hypothetical protein